MTKQTGIRIASVQIRWRLTDSNDAWHYISGVSPDAHNINLNGNWEKGKTYKVQARAFSDCGVPSDWGDEQDFTPGLGTDTPPSIITVTSQPLPLAVQFKITLGSSGKLPAGASIEVHTAPDVSGSPGSFSDTGLKPQGRQFIVGAPTNVPVWYMFRVVDNRGNEGAFSTPVKVTSTQITDVVGGTGGNLVDPLYAIVGSSKIPKYAVHTSWDIGRSTTDRAYGYKYLQLTSNSISAAPVLALVADTGDNTKRGWMPLSNKIYGVQTKMENVDSATDGLNFKFRFDNISGSALSGVLATRVGGGTGNGIWAANLDLTAATDTLVYLRMIWQNVVGVGKRVNCQGWAVFEMEGTSAVVPDFAAPATVTAGDLQDDPDNSGRAITTLGTTANRPAAGNAGTLYLATDGGTNGTHYRDDGANWVKVGVGHLGDADGTLDHVTDGAAYGKPLLSRLSAGKPFVDLSESINLGRTLANIADDVGSSRHAVSAVDGAGKALIDFSQAGHTNKGALATKNSVDLTTTDVTNKVIDNLGDSTYAKTLATRVSAGKPFVDLSESINLGRTLANISDTTTYKRTLATAFASGTNQLDLSLSATDGGVGGEGIIRADTVYLNDGAKLGVSADISKVTNLPGTVAQANASMMLTDAQTVLPLASATAMVLRNDGGPFYQDSQYHGESDGMTAGGSVLGTGNLTCSGSFQDFANPIVIPYPGAVSVTVKATAAVGFFASSIATVNIGQAQILMSFDAGSSWSTSDQVCNSPAPGIANVASVAGPIQFSKTGTPTGDIYIKLQVKQTNGSNVLTASVGQSSLSYDVTATANGAVLAGSLAVSIPATASASCTSTYPATSCAVNKNIRATYSGGKAPITLSTAKSAGTGTVGSSTSSNFSITDTETSTFAGATHTTTVSTTATDAETYNISGITWSGGVATATTTVAHSLVPGQMFDMQHVTPSGYNGTSLTALSGTTGSTLKFTVAVNPGAFSSAGAAPNVLNVKTVSANCVFTGTFNLSYAPVSVSISGTNPRAAGALGNTVTATGHMTGNATGGDGSISWVAVKTGGSFTVSGSTTQNPTVSESGTVPGSDTGTLKMTATDGHSNSGNASKSIEVDWVQNS